MRRRTLLVAVFGIGLVAYAALRLAASVPEAATTPAEAQDSGLVPPDSSLEEPQPEARVPILAAPATPASAVSLRLGGLVSLGPLPADELRKLREALAPVDRMGALLEAQRRAEASSRAEDHVEFFAELFRQAKVDAAQQLLARGDYITTPYLTILPTIPDDHAVFGLRNVAQVAGAGIDVWFCIDMREFPAVRNCSDMYNAAVRTVAAEEIEQFNRLPFAERKARFAAHVAAMSELSTLARAEGRDRLQERILALRKQVLPARFLVDRAAFTVTLREIKHH